MVSPIPKAAKVIMANRGVVFAEAMRPALEAGEE